MAMNAAEELSRRIRQALPDTSIEIDAPTHGSGYWWIDAARGNRKLTIEWRPKQGFGLSFGAGGYGEGPDIVLTSVDDAADRIFRFLQSQNERESSDRTVLLASGDFSWRSAIKERLKAHHVWADAVSSLAEAANSLSKETYLVVVIDVATETSHAFAAWREVLTTVNSLIVTVATSDHAPSFDDSIELVMHKRIGPEYVASVVESLVAAAATGRLQESPPKSA